ncbi:MAG TPA: dienelactone hydrolase family protein [Reyranella sp.]|nr:dienelactone hydrolase family protein [Reyranella sp.]
MEVLLPPAGRGRGVLVVHPWWGLNQTIRDYGVAVAQQGLAVGLPDLFEGAVVTEPAAAEALVGAHWQQAVGKLGVALAELGAHPAVTSPSLGAIGFSFGGFQLLRLIGPETPALRALVVYYAAHVGNFKTGHTKVLAHFAESDAFDGPEEQRDMAEALAAAKAGVVITHSGTKHWFAEADRPEYDRTAADLAFGETVAFLNAHL